MKNILIIGGGSGLGLALNQALAQSGHNLITAGRTRPIHSGTDHFFQIDATKVEWQKLLELITSQLNLQIDIIIYNSGSGVFGLSAAIPPSEAHKVFQLNFHSAAGCAVTAAEYWKINGIKGKFFLISSISARRAVPLEAYYSSAKTAAARFLECLQFEYLDDDISFKSIYLGLLKTDFRKNNQWFGLNPTFTEDGADISTITPQILKIITGKRKSTIIGWKERIIVLIDRFFPQLYNNLVLKKRTRHSLQK